MISLSRFNILITYSTIEERAFLNLNTARGLFDSEMILDKNG